MNLAFRWRWCSGEVALPRAQRRCRSRLDQLSTQADLRWLVPAHYSAPMVFGQKRIQQLKVGKTLERSPGLSLH